MVLIGHLAEVNPDDQDHVEYGSKEVDVGNR
jgi:hypothetical protein